MKTAKRKNRIRQVLAVLAAITAGAFILIVSAFLYLIRPFTEEPWVEALPNPVSIYDNSVKSSKDAGSIPVISPFHLQTDPMEGLLLINFEKDPDTVYIGFEPQSFDDTVHGRGLLVIGWRLDGKVDVFHDPGLRLDPETYGIAGSGLNVMTERSFSDALFKLGPAGAQADISFSDLQGRLVHLLVRETDTRPRNSFGLLAPMGSAASDPPALPLVYVGGFYFVRRAGTEYRIEIDGRSHRNDFIPLILDRTRVYFLRYSYDPFIVTWNPDAAAEVRILEPETDPADGVFTADAEGVRYEIADNAGFLEIRQMSRQEGDHEVVVEFNPPFPQLLSLADSSEAAGEFLITAQPGAGTVRGSWKAERRGGEIYLEVTPDKGWTPGTCPRMARLLFRAVSIFRTWPVTYVWRGIITLPPPGSLELEQFDFQSGWERISL